ncbi:MAG: hypothetical protein ACT4PT_03165 [Methanobacteriota archaeon]
MSNNNVACAPQRFLAWLAFRSNVAEHAESKRGESSRGAPLSRTHGLTSVAKAITVAIQLLDVDPQGSDLHEN